MDTDQNLEPNRVATRRLAAALRGFVADLVEHTVSEQDALGLLDGVEALRSRVTGGHRSRYYEASLVGSPSSAFIDFSPISGLSHPFGVPMDIEPGLGPDGAPGVVAHLRVGLAHEGPPHGVHGGVIAAVFDELLGHAQHAHGIQALTASLTVRYRALTPIDQDLELSAQVVHVEGRRWHGKATCRVGGILTAEADALFVGVDLESIAAG